MILFLLTWTSFSHLVGKHLLDLNFNSCRWIEFSSLFGKLLHCNVQPCSYFDSGPHNGNTSFAQNALFLESLRASISILLLFLIWEEHNFFSRLSSLRWLSSNFRFWAQKLLTRCAISIYIFPCDYVIMVSRALLLRWGCSVVVFGESICRVSSLRHMRVIVIMRSGMHHICCVISV